MKRIVFQGVAVACVGLAVGAILRTLSRSGTYGWVPNSPDFLMASAMGGCVGGLATFWAFGRPGWLGWGLALIGATLASALGGFVGGLVLGPFLAGVMGAHTVLVGLVELPLLGLFWLSLMACIHLSMLALRVHSETVRFPPSAPNA